jgi:hypothetical protein
MFLTILFLRRKKMKRSLGPSIKISAVAIFVLGSVGSLYLAYQKSEIYFSSLIDKPEKGVIVFALISILGILLSWIISVCLRGFGELAENVSRLEDEVSSLQKDMAYMKIVAASVLSINEQLKLNAGQGKNVSSAPSTSGAVDPNEQTPNVGNKEENEI